MHTQVFTFQGYLKTMIQPCEEPRNLDSSQRKQENEKSRNGEILVFIRANRKCWYNIVEIQKGGRMIQGQESRQEKCVLYTNRRNLNVKIECGVEGEVIQY